MLWEDINTWDTIVLIAGISATLLLGVSYVPQILKLHKDKTAEGISTSFWYILDLSLLMLFILAIDSGQTSLIIAQGLNLLLALIVTGQVVYYKRKA